MTHLRWLRLNTFRLGLLITLAFLLLKSYLGLQSMLVQSGGLMQRAEYLWLDTKFHLRGGFKPEEFQKTARVVIAAVDELSLRDPELGMWPWPRSKIAALIRQLHRCGARVVGFDMVFSEEDASRLEKELENLFEAYQHWEGSDSPFFRHLDERLQAARGDQQMARAIEEAGNVVLGYFVFVSQEDTGGLDREDILGEEAEEVDMSAIGLVKPFVPEAEACARFVMPVGVRGNLQLLARSTDYFGFFNASSDEDGIFRKEPLVFCFERSRPDGAKLRSYLPSLALQVLSVWQGQPIELFIKDFENELYLGPLGVPGPEHLRLPVDQRGRLRVNFYGPQKTFRHLSARDIIALEKLQDDQLQEGAPGEICSAVRDRIVLVGSTAVGVYDLRPTPFDGHYPGVELHASVIENVLRSETLRRPWMLLFGELAFMLLSGLVFSWLLGRIRLGIGLVFSLLFMSATLGGDYLFLFRRGYQAEVVLGLMQQLVLFIAIAIWRYATEEREKSRLRHAFQLYLSKEVIDEVLRDTKKLKLGGERREVTVMFSDIRGFTSLSENMPPEQLTELLNEYFTPMTEIVLQEHGTLDKYIGDALMAFWGAPIAFGDHPHAACRSALRMLEELERLRRGWMARNLPNIEVGMGINTGEVSVGNMGSARRFDYTVIGDNVNLASRLEGLNKTYGTRIIVSETTRQAVGQHFTLRLLDMVRVKGKARPVRIFELLHRGPPDPVRDGWIAHFEKAFEAYQQGKFSEARLLFEKLPDDPPSRLFVERCRQLEQKPPEEEWDGVYQFKSK